MRATSGRCSPWRKQRSPMKAEPHWPRWPRQRSDGTIKALTEALQQYSAVGAGTGGCLKGVTLQRGIRPPGRVQPVSQLPGRLLWIHGLSNSSSNADSTRARCHNFVDVFCGDAADGEPRFGFDRRDRRTPGCVPNQAQADRFEGRFSRRGEDRADTEVVEVRVSQCLVGLEIGMSRATDQRPAVQLAACGNSWAVTLAEM